MNKNDICDIINKFIKLGFTILSDRSSKYYGIKDCIVIHNIINNSQAYNAGLNGAVIDDCGRITIGDVIISINGKVCWNYSNFYNILDKLKKNDIVDLIIYKNNNCLDTKYLKFKL